MPTTNGLKQIVKVRLNLWRTFGRISDWCFEYFKVDSDDQFCKVFFPKKKNSVTATNNSPKWLAFGRLLSHAAPMVTLPEVFPNISQTTYNSPPQDHPHRESIKRKASTNLYKAESNVFGSHVFMFRGIESRWRYSCNSLWWISNKSRFKVLITYWELSKNICWYMLPNGKLMVMDMYKGGMFIK